MKVYKYRGGEKEILERDIKSLKQNYFWASKFDTLNDPCEIQISTNIYRKLANEFSNVNEKRIINIKNKMDGVVNEFLEKGKKIGIYSLSKTYDDPLLWAYYGNAHKGFCIEYDLDVLLKTYPSDDIFSFDVIYSDSLPEFNPLDFIKAKKNYAIQKLCGYKSLEWKHEKEYRIIIDDFGPHIYDYQALKAIYFGLRMSKDWQEKIMDSLKGRGIKYYKMKLIENSYKFTPIEVKDLLKEERTYLSYIPNLECRGTTYKILNKDFNKFKGKATITIELEKKVGTKELTWFSKVIKSDLFSSAKRIFLLFYISNYFYDNGYWAVSQYTDNEFEVKIHGLTIQEEEVLKKKLTIETRNVIGMWIDDAPFMGAAWIFLKDTDSSFVLESHSIKRGVYIEKYKPYKINNEVRYKYEQNNSDKEYFVIDSKGILRYYSGEEMLMKKLQPFKI